MKMKQLRELSEDELHQKKTAFQKELFELNYQRKFGNVEKPGRFKVLKRSLARMETLLNERKRDESSKR